MMFHVSNYKQQMPSLPAKLAPTQVLREKLVVDVILGDEWVGLKREWGFRVMSDLWVGADPLDTMTQSQTNM
jgi:hypothetical protein